MQKANLIISIDTTTIILRTSKEMHGKKQCKNMILNLHRAKNELSSMKWKKGNIYKIYSFNKKEKKDIWKEKP